jgi:hypothetical protein
MSETGKLTINAKQAAAIRLVKQGNSGAVATHDLEALAQLRVIDWPSPHESYPPRVSMFGELTLSESGL